MARRNNDFDLFARQKYLTVFLVFPISVMRRNCRRKPFDASDTKKGRKEGRQYTHTLLNSKPLFKIFCYFKKLNLQFKNEKFSSSHERSVQLRALAQDIFSRGLAPC